MLRDVYLLHGRGGNPNTTVAELERLLKFARRVDVRDNVTFHRPELPHTDPALEAGLAYEQFVKNVEIAPNAIVIGNSMGGLIASKLQESRPDITVFTLNSPTNYESLALRPGKRSNLFALYSSQDSFLGEVDRDPIRGPILNWPEFTDAAYDVPWMRNHEISQQKYSVALVLHEFLTVLGEEEVDPASVGAYLRTVVDEINSEPLLY